MKKFWCLLTLSAAILSAQGQQPEAQYGSGVSTTYSFFDPLAPHVPYRAPAGSPGVITLPRYPVIPLADYESRKSAPPARIPSPTAPPSLVSSDETQPPRLPVALTPSLSFEGIQQTIYQPPSSNIAAGPQDILQIVNSTVARFDRTGQMTSQTVLQQWFADQYALVCASQNCVFGDVSIRYDSLQGHFLMTLQSLDTTSQTSYYLISVSNGTTFDSGWKNWALNARYDGSTLTGNWADFPQVGYDNNAVYLTANMFSLSSFTFQYAKLRILKKSELYNPATTSLTYSDIFNLRNADGTVASTLQAPVLRGRTQVQTATGYMINASDVAQASYLTLWRINDPVSANPSVTSTTLQGIWKYNYPFSAPQLGTTLRLDTGPSSIGKAVMRDGVIYIAWNTGYTDEPTTVTYDVIDVASNKVALQYRWINGNFFYPAFDVPATVGPGYNLPNNLIVGTTTSPTGTLTYAGLTNVKDGEDFYDLAASTTARWGDYNGAGVDPIQGGLWVSGEYAKTRVGGASRYGTWNAYFPGSTSQEFDDIPPSDPNFNYVNILRMWGVTKGCSATPKLYCPDQPLTREATAVFIIRSLYGDSFPYTTTPYFTDVPSSSPNFPYVQKFRDLGLTSGCGATTYCPSDFTTRLQVATFIVRAKLKLLQGDNFYFPSQPYFTDVPANDPNFSYIQKFREFGYTNGCSVSAYCPSMLTTREQMAVFIVRAFFN